VDFDNAHRYRSDRRARRVGPSQAEDQVVQRAIIVAAGSKRRKMPADSLGLSDRRRKAHLRGSSLHEAPRFRSAVGYRIILAVSSGSAPSRIPLLIVSGSRDNALDRAVIALLFADPRQPTRARGFELPRHALFHPTIPKMNFEVSGIPDAFERWPCLLGERDDPAEVES